MNNTLNFKSSVTDFKPNAVLRKLNLNYGQLRHWRKTFDPNPNRSFFSGKDLLIYGCLKFMIEWGNAQPKKLKKFNWNKFFIQFYSLTTTQLMDYAFVYDGKNNRLYFTDNFEIIDINKSWVQLVKPSEVRDYMEEKTMESIKENLEYINEPS